MIEDDRRGGIVRRVLRPAGPVPEAARDGAGPGRAEEPVQDVERDRARAARVIGLWRGGRCDGGFLLDGDHALLLSRWFRVCHTICVRDDTIRARMLHCTQTEEYYDAT